jgi:hypothetical protein
MIYSLQDFVNITFDGFDLKLPNETIDIIQELSTQVGSPTYIKTPVFQKRDKTKDSVAAAQQPKLAFRKKRSNKNVEINDSDWETLRTFHATKLEQKVGLEAEIDVIRSHLNKMSDKNYDQMKTNIVDILDRFIEEGISPEEMIHVSSTIFDIASNNRFFSKVYADLYSELIQKYEIMKEIFDKSFQTFIELFQVIEYVDPDVDYNKYCKINKDNEKRKSLSSFFVNLSKIGVLKVEQLVDLTHKMLSTVVELMKQEEKKSQVDEYIENIALLYNKHLFNGSENENNYLVEGKTIIETIKMLSLLKVKMYPSLSNKSIFKCMDIVDV